MNEISTIRINFKGGIVSPGDLKSILVALKSMYVTEIGFGLRQQLIFNVESSYLTTIAQRFEAINCDYQIGENKYGNTISSYVSEEVFQRSKWLTEGIYKDVLEQIDTKSKLKINICDSEQSFCPFFTGHLNFISSSLPHFWHLYIRQPKSNELITFEKLVYTNDIAEMCASIESELSIENELIEILKEVSSSKKYILQDKTEKLKLPRFSLPYYEGFNRYGEKTWLGIYQRYETFNSDFLIQLCTLAQSTKIGEICITPWKSLVIKNIKKEHRPSWSSLLAEYNINVRHAANELNWQIEDNSSEARKLKQKLINYFNKRDLRTFGICLGIKTVPHTEVFASIMVRQKSWSLLPFFKLYDISYTNDYDPNGREVSFFEQNILPWNLPSRLYESVVAFNKKIAIIDNKAEKNPEKEPVLEAPTNLFQCAQCFTIYDENYGDPLNGISPQIPFAELPHSFSCSTCEAPKSSYRKVEEVLFA